MGRWQHMLTCSIKIICSLVKFWQLEACVCCTAEVVSDRGDGACRQDYSDMPSELLPNPLNKVSICCVSVSSETAVQAISLTFLSWTFMKAIWFFCHNQAIIRCCYVTSSPLTFASVNHWNKYWTFATQTISAENIHYSFVSSPWITLPHCRV